MFLGRCVLLAILFSSTLTTYLFEDSTECSECEPGYYYNGTVCSNCTAGSCPVNSNSSLCSVCQPGTFQNLSNATFCYQCELGTYQNESQSLACLQCPPTYYCPDSGMKDPLPCPKDYTCPGGSSQPQPLITSATLYPTYAPCGDLQTKSDGMCIYSSSFIAIVVCSFLFGIFLITVLVLVLYKLVYKSKGYNSSYGTSAYDDKESLLKTSLSGKGSFTARNKFSN